ncbi:protein kinase, partial [Streptomyces sp. Isolate_45]|uniref:protein kinase n=1 Tax=Streptomyces sp. Isolate_45 TaxID=2950111 RepID=UPI0032B157D5|nr:serine/threonine protein kinase [Streptomyces sp. Isolate_45]
MEDYAGRILAGRYRLPLPPSDAYEVLETRAFDTRSGQEVLVRQVPLPEVVDAELLDGSYDPQAGQGQRTGELPAVRRAIAAAQAAASVPDHARLDQVFDVFAEGGSLWIVSELVPARPLAALIAEEPLSPYRAAEVASDVLTALRVLHAHGWTHRNITVRTVLICDDGRVVLTGLAAGAAEEALCGYDPVPRPDFEDPADADPGWGPPPGPGPGYGVPSPDPFGSAFGSGPQPPAPDPAYRPEPAAPEPAYAPLVAPGYDTGPRYSDHITPQRALPPQDDAADLQATARAGTIAAYRAGARAAAAK